MPIEPTQRAAAAAAAATGPQATGPPAAESAVPKAAPPQFDEAAVPQAPIANMSPEAAAIMQKIVEDRFQGIWPKNPELLDEMVKEVEQRLRWELGVPPKAPMQGTWMPANYHHTQALFAAKGAGQGSSAEYSGPPGKGNGGDWQCTLVG